MNKRRFDMKTYLGIILIPFLLASCVNSRSSDQANQGQSACRPEVSGSESKQAIAVAFSRLNACRIGENDLSNLLNLIEK